MSLTHEQRYLLEELREYLRRVEKLAVRHTLNLNDFNVEYSGVSYTYSPRLKSVPHPAAAMRRNVFEKAMKPEDIYYLPESD
jgi:hypothetical protein